MTTFFTWMIAGVAVLVSPLFIFRILKHFWIQGEAVITGVRLGRTKTPDERIVRTFHIQYQYVVGGRRFSGSDSMQIDLPYYKEDAAIKNLKETYSPGDAITVFYAKSLPQMSALRRSVAFGPALYPLGFAVLIVIAAYLFLSGAFTESEGLANQAAQSTAASVTPPARQEARQP